MGKQAAMDIYCTGKVGIGNIYSITMMKEEDQMYIMLVYNIPFTQHGITKIQNGSSPR